MLYDASSVKCNSAVGIQFLLLGERDLHVREPRKRNRCATCHAKERS